MNSNDKFVLTCGTHYLRSNQGLRFWYEEVIFLARETFSWDRSIILSLVFVQPRHLNYSSKGFLSLLGVANCMVVVHKKNQVLPTQPSPSHMHCPSVQMFQLRCLDCFTHFQAQASYCAFIWLYGNIRFFFFPRISLLRTFQPTSSTSHLSLTL